MRKAWLALILLLGSVPFVGGCGQICIAGMGNCEVFRKWNTAAPTGSGAQQFQLVATPDRVAPGGTAVLKVTTTNPRATSSGCDWKVAETGIGADYFQGEYPPTVASSLCTAQYRAPNRDGVTTIRVTEKTSGTQLQITITVGTGVSL